MHIFTTRSLPVLALLVASASAFSSVPEDSPALSPAPSPAPSPSPSPSSSPSPSPSPLPVLVNPGGHCVITDGGSCATNAGYPGTYGKGDECTLTNVPEVLLDVPTFNLDSYFVNPDAPEKGCEGNGWVDYVLVNGVKYCGTTGPTVVASNGTITWKADLATYGGQYNDENTDTGWKICWGPV